MWVRAPPGAPFFKKANIVTNARFDVVDDGLHELIGVFKLIIPKHHRYITGYAIRDADKPPADDTIADMLKDASKAYLLRLNKFFRPHRMVFFWSDYAKAKDYIPFPFKMTAEDAATFAYRWLMELEYPEEPDIDGDCEKGWRAYTEDWNFVDNDHSTAIAVSPLWIMYGK